MKTTDLSRIGVDVDGVELALGLSPLLARTQRSSLHIRCECGVCGAHSYSLPDEIDIERCGNCLNARLSPIEEIVQQAPGWGGDVLSPIDAPGEIRTRAARVKSPAL